MSFSFKALLSVAFLCFCSGCYHSAVISFGNSLADTTEFNRFKKQASGQRGNITFDCGEKDCSYRAVRILGISEDSLTFENFRGTITRSISLNSVKRISFRNRKAIGYTALGFGIGSFVLMRADGDVGYWALLAIPAYVVTAVSATMIGKYDVYYNVDHLENYPEDRKLRDRFSPRPGVQSQL